MRIGDLVEHAGIIANVPIFRAPDLGFTGTVPADAVVEAVRTHALVGLDTGGVSQVVVIRASRTIPAKDIEDCVAQALSAKFGLGEAKNIGVNFEREMRTIQVEPTAKGEPRVARITYDPRSGKFDATLELPTGAVNRGMLRLSGRALATAEVVTVLRPVERGGILRESRRVGRTAPARRDRPRFHHRPPAGDRLCRPQRLADWASRCAAPT